MPNAVVVRIACALRNHVALRRVTACAERLGGKALALTAVAIAAATSGAGIDAVVCDLEPGDVPAVESVRRIHRARPDWPLWIYYEPREPIVQRVADVAMLSGVWATAQVGQGAQDAEVQVHVQRLIESVPVQRLLHYLDPLLWQLPVGVGGFLVSELGRRNDALSDQAPAARTAANARSEQRHLERLCNKAGLPTPSALLDHLVLAHVAFRSFTFNIRLGNAGEDAGLSPKALRALLHRVMGTNAQWVARAPASAFEFAILSFAKVCNLPEQLARHIVRQVDLERSA